MRELEQIRAGLLYKLSNEQPESGAAVERDLALLDAQEIEYFRIREGHRAWIH
jgi:hypothetical protein